LQQQPAKVLALLLQRAGELVTRDEIRGFVWGQDTYVNFDQGLNFCIKEIRAALGDSAELPRFIETLPRRGYRFIAPVEVVARAALAPVAHEAAAPRAARRAPSAPQLLVFALLALALLLTGVLLFWPAPPPRAKPGARVRIAVLPFENLSADPDQDYLSEGLAEELIAQLGRCRRSGWW
jgi:DNA-binding winged helix-turn-helix (wHTH) protein